MTGWQLVFLDMKVLVWTTGSWHGLSVQYLPWPADLLL
jgi:hypothetical protein